MSKHSDKKSMIVTITDAHLAHFDARAEALRMVDFAFAREATPESARHVAAAFLLGQLEAV
ncbi:MAG TPA: hypothetical protein VF316_25300 [Polyangiaceae bacterium]